MPKGSGKKGRPPSITGLLDAGTSRELAQLRTILKDAMQCLESNNRDLTVTRPRTDHQLNNGPGLFSTFALPPRGHDPQFFNRTSDFSPFLLASHWKDEFGAEFEKEVHGTTTRAAAFDLKTCKKALADSGEYVCQGNILWPGDGSSGVPYRNSAVEETMRLKYSEPVEYGEDLVVAVATASANPMSDLGKMQAVSPEEDRLAFLRAAVRDLGDKKKAAGWRRALSSVQVRFIVLTTEKACEISKTPQTTTRDYFAIITPARRRII